MPFTVSHVAAVLPFSRALNRRHLLSAMVIGSMAPDFGVFLPWQLERGQTHGLHPLLTFCLPLGLFAYWLFQYLIKPPLFELLPDRVYWRWHDHANPAPIMRIGQWCVAAIGVIGGAITHLAWDGFTHEGARGVQMFPSLDERTFDIAGHNVYGFAALQLVSSVVGLAVVIGFIQYALRSESSDLHQPPRRLTSSRRHVWLATSLFAATLLSFALFIGASYGILGSHRFQHLAGEAAVACLRAAAAVLVATALLLRFALRQSQ